MDYIKREDALTDFMCEGVSCQKCPFLVNPINGGCMIENYIKALPAADVVERPRWTPCKDRMPEVDGMYLFCTLNGETHVWHSSTVKYSLEHKLFKPTMPIAWMPLPEPYKED